jgi:CubicO group peptidase (beta-lactamase class C family)
MQLVDEGKLDLDAPVNRYLKGFQIPSPYDKETPLTVRHLLSHHGGIANGAEIVELWSRRLPTSVDQIVHKQIKVTSKPGVKFAYSNYAYTFNGWLLGQLGGNSFESAIRQRLLSPLEMNRTFFEPTAAMCENLAIPYQLSLDSKKLDPVPRTRLDVYPAGDVYSTPTDLAHFLLLHINGGKYGGKQIVSAKSIAEMAKLQFAKKEEKSGVGLGWMIQGIGSHRTLWHNGAVPGFYTSIRRWALTLTAKWALCCSAIP